MGATVAAGLASAQNAADERREPRFAIPHDRPASEQRITPNFKEADITMIAEAVSAATGKNFILDPRVRAQVTMLSSTPMSPAAFYQAFLSILEVYGFNAEPAGDVIKIVPDANARQHPGDDLPDHVSSTSDEFVTDVINVKNVSAAQLVPILRPMIPQYGHLAAYPPSNILIISDRAANVNRMIRLIRRIDVQDSDVDIVPLQNASSAEVVRVVNELYQGRAASMDGGAPIKVVADERSNSVLISGDQAERLRLRALVVHLDTPVQTVGNTRVRYLRFADAEKIAPKLKEQITGIAQASRAGSGQGGATAKEAAEKNAMIWADPSTNALVITAPPRIMQAVMMIIDKLDIRRPQVHVEVIIADMDTDKSASLGVNWAAFSKGGSVPVASFSSEVGGTSLVDLVSAAESGTAGLANAATLLNGATFGVGRLGNSGISFAAMLHALRSDSSTDIISTPNTTTLDNQEATMESAEEVPFVTGQYTSGTATTNGVVTPFQTIQREEVGTILKVTPTIAAEGNSIIMKISIEDSSISTSATTSAGSDPITNKRKIETNVLIQNGGWIVLGGLTKDENTNQEDRVPFLGNVPLLGLLFKSRAGDHSKNNLMIFIRPTILRQDSEAAEETDSKYNFMLDEERRDRVHDLLPILPFEHAPQLPPLPPPPPDTDAPAPVSPAEKERAAQQGSQSGTQFPGNPAPQSH